MVQQPDLVMEHFAQHNLEHEAAIAREIKRHAEQRFDPFDKQIRWLAADFKCRRTQVSSHPRYDSLHPSVVAAGKSEPIMDKPEPITDKSAPIKPGPITDKSAPIKPEPITDKSAPIKPEPITDKYEPCIGKFADHCAQEAVMPDTLIWPAGVLNGAYAMYDLD